MAEETGASRYVKLSKVQDAPMEEIHPGELNQPIQIPQLEIPRCLECGQTLPESYRPPANEPWTTGICGCLEDIESCWSGLFCPCVLFGQNVERLREEIPWTSPCVCHAIFIEGGIALAVATAAFHCIDPRATFLIGECLVFSWWMCAIYTGISRQTLQKKYHLENSPCDPCMVHCCMHSCANCQEYREMRGRLSDNIEMPTSVVRPPSMQRMSSRENHDSEVTSTASQHNQNSG